jgi:hypothetical protein
MNIQEHEQLSQILKQLCAVRLTDKDQDAEAMIREASAVQPDAAYLLVQRVLLMEQALNNAKARIEALESNAQNSQTAGSGSFLDNNPWSQAGANKAGAVPGINNFQPRNTPPQPPANNALSGSSGFLSNLATTAAGVVAGSFLFQGIENLMGNHSSGFGAQNSEPEIINNYYNDDQGQQADNSSNDNSLFASNDDYDDNQDDDDSFDSDWT